MGVFAHAARGAMLRRRQDSMCRGPEQGVKKAPMSVQCVGREPAELRLGTHETVVRGVVKNTSIDSSGWRSSRFSPRTGFSSDAGRLTMSSTFTTS